MKHKMMHDGWKQARAVAQPGIAFTSMSKSMGSTPGEEEGRMVGKKEKEKR